MNQIRLYIENEEIELVEQIQFAINKQFEDINNPTSIINDYSKTINIPFSQHNNAVFGKIFSPDRVIIGGQLSVTGLAFDPYRKLNFRLEWNESVLMQGYAKLLNIVYQKGIGHYEVSLNGELGKLFQEFKKITFVYNEDTSNYWIDTKDYFVEEINKELIYSCWNTGSQLTMNLEKQYTWVVDPSGGQPIKVKNPLYHFTDIMGFVPSNTFDDDFKYDTVQYNNVKTKTISDYLDFVNFEQATGFQSDTVVGDGLLPRQIGEYRSYYQQPFIYFNKLFKMFQEKAQSLTDYTFSLDSSFFNNENAYWRLFAMTLNKLDVNLERDKQDYNNDYMMSASTYSHLKQWNANDDFSIDSSRKFGPVAIVHENASICCDLQIPLDDRFYNVPDDITGLNIQLEIPIALTMEKSSDSRDTNKLTQQSALELEIEAIYGDASGVSDISNGQSKYFRCAVLSDDTTQDNLYDSYLVVKIGELEQSVTPPPGTYYNIVLKPYFFIPSKFERVKFVLHYRWLHNTYPINNTHQKGSVDLWVNNPNILCNITTMDYVPRSYYNFSLADLWNNEYSLFDIILRYCKMFRILIEVDHIHKIIYFRQQKKYFENYTVEDWTDKLDMSNDYKLEPVQWDFKYIGFNYDDSGIKLDEDYKNKYGYNYGSYILKTAYNFNDETNDIFDKCRTSIINTDNVLSFHNLFQYRKIIYSYSDTEEFVYSKDEDEKYVTNFGAFYFYNGLKNFDDTAILHLRCPVAISDDTDMQINANTYCYQNGANQVLSYKYLSLQNYTMKNYRNYLSLFNVPKESYTKTNHFTNSVSIYEAFWQRYIEERYSIQNKKLTAYFKISPRDFMQFKFNKFVIIRNQLYFVNKIFDYDLTSNNSTKVELITILNPDNYWMNNF